MSHDGDVPMEGAAQGPRFTSRLQAEAKRVEDHGRISTGTPTDIQPVAHFPQTDPQLIDQLNQRNEGIERSFTAVGQTFVQTQEAFRNMSLTVENVHLRAEERTQANRNHLEEERESRRQGERRIGSKNTSPVSTIRDTDGRTPTTIV